MKIIKVVLVVLVLGIASFGIYAYKLHSLAVEGNKIFEYRCTNVNPRLIAYKNSYIKMVDCLKNSGTENSCSREETVGALNDYISGLPKYIEEEDKWLGMQRSYMDRKDFKFIEPWYIKQAGEYQWKMYEGYRDDAKGMLTMIEQKSEEADSLQAEARDRRNEFSQKYFDFFDEASSINDWRKIFANVPVPAGCTKENLIIPQTEGLLDFGSN